jgi:hypothetical protein
MHRIFVSYRRSDSQDVTGRIYDRLLTEFGPGALFKDVDAIPLGADFKQHLIDLLTGSSRIARSRVPYWGRTAHMIAKIAVGE